MNWMQTYTGIHFDLDSPSIENLDIKDIAHHLSMLCRFNGACAFHYSVAEHSVRVCDSLPDNLKFAGLMHDAAEAYIGDIIRPVKTPKIKHLEARLNYLIAKKWDIANWNNSQIKFADDVLLATEHRDLMKDEPGWVKLPPPLYSTIVPISQPAAKILFMDRFKQYSGVK